MEIIDAIQMRKSIRGYKPDPIPKDVLRKILEASVRSPSAMNTQPWEITILTGKALDKVRRGNVEMLNSGVKPALATHKPYQGIHRQRQVDLAIHIFQLMGIAREDKGRRAEWLERGFRFFDAPTAIILSLDDSVEESLALLDLGALCQSICLVALDYGLGTCIEDQGIFFPEVLRKSLGIPKSKRIVISIAIGYPDWDFPANKLESNRESVENVTTWFGFD